MNAKPKIILDCDPGVDDMFAIFCALEYCEVVAITTVAGNVAVEHTTNNALGLVEMAQAAVPVHRGAAGPRVGEAIDAADVHGANGLGGVPLPPLTTAVAGEDASGALVELAAPDVTVVAVGPLTNIAAAIETDPAWPTRIERLVIMGGSTDAGNVTAAAEFNIWADPEAAEIVFESGIDVTMVGLNLTRQVRMGDPEIARLRATGHARAGFAADALEYYAEYARTNFGVAETAMHDPCAVLYCVRPDLFDSRSMRVAVETSGNHTRGMTLCDLRPNADQANATALVGVRAEAIIDLVIAATIGD